MGVLRLKIMQSKRTVQSMVKLASCFLSYPTVCWTSMSLAAASSSCSTTRLLSRRLACSCSCLVDDAAPISRQRQRQRRRFSSAPLPSPLRHPPTSSTSSASSSSSSLSPTAFGQPLPATHPHLLQQGQLTIGIPYSEYEARRSSLMDSLPDGSVVVLAGGRLQYSSQSIFYKFRQLSDFIYLTGWLEQDAAVVLGAHILSITRF